MGALGHACCGRNRRRPAASGTPSRDIAAQCPAGQWIKAFSLSRGTRAKTDRIDAELIARFMLFRPEAGRTLPSENLHILRALTTRRAQIVDMRKRLMAQIAARRKQGIPADVEAMDDALKAMLDTQVGDLERRIERVIAQEEISAAKARLLRSIPGIGPVSAAMLPLVHANMHCRAMDRGNAGTRPDERRRGRSHDRPRSGATRQWKDARQAGNRWRAAGAATCAVPGCTCRRMSQSGAEAGRTAPQGTRQAAQAHHRRHRAQARHHRKRDPQNRCPMETSTRHIDTVARPHSGSPAGRRTRSLCLLHPRAGRVRIARGC